MSATHSSFGAEAVKSRRTEIADPLRRRLSGGRGPLFLATPDALEPFLAHQPPDPVAAHVDTAAAELTPRLADPVDAPVALARPVDLADKLAVLEFSQRRLPARACVVGRAGTPIVAQTNS